MRIILIILLLATLASGVSATVSGRFSSLLNILEDVQRNEPIQKQQELGVFDETNWDGSDFQ